MYQVRRSALGKPLNFRLCDTQGLEESQGIDAHDVAYMLDGNVPDGYQVSNNRRKGIDKIYTKCIEGGLLKSAFPSMHSNEIALSVH